MDFLRSASASYAQTPALERIDPRAFRPVLSPDATDGSVPSPVTPQVKSYKLRKISYRHLSVFASPVSYFASACYLLLLEMTGKLPSPFKLSILQWMVGLSFLLFSFLVGCRTDSSAFKFGLFSVWICVSASCHALVFHNTSMIGDQAVIRPQFRLVLSKPGARIGEQCV